MAKAMTVGHQGVQATILYENPEAFSDSFGSHNLNLFPGDVAKSLVTAFNSLKLHKSLYLISNVSISWGHLKNEKCLSSKPLLETRWECHIKA
jgi:hypothetical protein